jgi:hypothetical protein
VLASLLEAARMLPSAARSPIANAPRRRSALARTVAVVMQPATALLMHNAVQKKSVPVLVSRMQI